MSQPEEEEEYIGKDRFSVTRGHYRRALATEGTLHLATEILQFGLEGSMKRTLIAL